MESSAVFAGMMTLDVAHTVPDVPAVNEKIVAGEQFVAAGGPATNAAVTYAALAAADGKEQVTHLYTICGSGILADAARDDVTECGVTLHDMSGAAADVLPVSLILVQHDNGDRAVSGRSPLVTPVVTVDPDMPVPDVMMFDGHHCDIAGALGRAYPDTLTILDGGSWKDRLVDIVEYVDIAVVSADFMPPGCHSVADMVDYLRSVGIEHIVRTDGGADVTYWWATDRGTVSGVVPVDACLRPRCTLGAGDIFHGAFTWACAQGGMPGDAAEVERIIRLSSQVAGLSLNTFGTRQWLDDAALSDVVRQFMQENR